ncbi:hypothetical protein HZA97_08435 [Candidatus Woesearchaeota archaeon]|nr:hypothetical protein [Candidatus Woesearchaeota archaeon]
MTHRKITLTEIILSCSLVGNLILAGCDTNYKISYTESNSFENKREEKSVEDKISKEKVIGDHSVISGRVYYFGEEGDINRAVCVKFDGQIQGVLERLNKKYGYYPDLVITSSKEFEAFCSNHLTVSAGCFGYQEKESFDLASSVLIHEYGHYKFQDGLPFLWKKSEIYADFESIYEKVMLNGIIYTFKDSNFLSNPRAGHPNDNPQELYASAFMIVEAGFLEEYKKRFFPVFTEEQRELAEKIFEFVQRVK